ncbi:MAG: hypothetical protein J5958_01845 [Clostridia bacterium]|nr:hypothetical protein [Clostridia bacterium]
MGLLSIGAFFETEFFDRELPAFSALPNTLRAWEVNLGVGLFLLAVVVAVGILAYRRLAPERIARELFARKVFSPDEALSCADLSVKHSLLLRFSLHNRFSDLRRCVLIAGEEPLDLSKKSRAERKAARANREKNPFVALKKHFFPDLSEARFYLDPERADEVDRRYVEIRGVTPRAFVWTAVVSVVLFFVLCRLMPSILGLIDNIIS